MLSKPQFFTNQRDIPHHVHIIESFSQALKELFVIEHPSLKNKFSEQDNTFQNFVKKYQDQEIWIYYPWNNNIVHTCSEKLYFKIRTARNRNIITEEEQKKYRNMTVGIAGLSVGSSILSALTMNGGPKYFKIADFDTLEISNLNRIRATLLDVGMKKTDIAAKNIWELDPFAEISLFESGINEQNIEAFILQNPKLDMFIDEMDSIPMKIVSRRTCRTHKIPVVMVTDNGNSVILDIERFDKEPERKLLHGIMEHMHLEKIKNVDFQSWVNLAIEIVGSSSLSERMKQSIKNIGITLSGIPQLGTSASLGASAVAFVVRNIANGKEMPSGRYHIEFEKFFSL